MLTVVQILYSGLGGQSSVFFSLVEADVLYSAETGAQRIAEHHAVFYGREALVQDYANKCNELGISCRHWLKGPGLDLRNQWRIAKHVASLNPHVFIVHSPQWILAARLVKCFSPRCKIVAVEHHPNMLKTRGKWFLSAILPWLSDSVVYLTQTYKRQVASRTGPCFRPRRAQIIPNGVNVSRFCPADTYPATGYTVGMASRLSDQKDIDTLVRAFASLLAKHPDRPLMLRLAGDGDHRAALVELAATLGISDKIIFDGLLTEREMVGFYQRLTLYVHATRSETMSTSVVQALSCGVPVIASDIPGMSDILPPATGAGSLVPVGDVHRLAERMDALLTDTETLSARATEARQYVEESLSSRVSLMRYLNVVPVIDGHSDHR